jgi:hypothetical protein
MPPECIVIWLLYHVGCVLGQLIHELLYGIRALHYRVEFVRRVVVCQGGAGIISAALAPLSPRSSHGPGD